MAYRKYGALVFVLLFLPCHRAFSDGQSARTAYMRGIQWERARNYSRAVSEYQSALQAYPHYYWADRELGNCYYYLGNKAKALEAYDRYLRAAPTDQRIKRFAESLRRSQGTALASSGLDGRTMEFGFGLGYGLYAMSDWNNSVTNTESDLTAEGYSASGGQINGGVDLDLDFKYYFNDLWDAGLKLDYMTASGTLSVEGNSAAFSFPVIFFGAQGDYTFYERGPLRIHGGSALGLLTLMNATESITSSYGSASSGFSGSGFGLEARVGADWFVTHNLSITGVLGYRYAAISQVTESDATQEALSGGATGTLDYSGPFLTLGIAYWK